MPSLSRRRAALSPEYALLGFLTHQPAHGYELHQQLAANLGQVWHVSLSQTYNILNRLETQGFVAGTIEEQARHPARRRFRLTAAGRRRFDAWLYSLTGCRVRAIRVEFLTRLYFARALGLDPARALLEAQITETRGCLHRLQTMLADLPADQVFNRLGVELRIRQLTSIIDWLTESSAVLGIPDQVST